VEAAIDSDPKTGWGIDPAEGAGHVAIFELAQSLALPPGSTLEVRLDHADRQHSIGRLRLSVTTATPPIPVPRSGSSFLVRGTIPPTKTGGVLALSDAFFLESGPHWSLQCKSGLQISATCDGLSIDGLPAIDNGMYAAPWQTWRWQMEPAGVARSFEVRIHSSLPARVEHRFSAHFLPEDQSR
jgi:hypothetical protein